MSICVPIFRSLLFTIHRIMTEAQQVDPIIAKLDNVDDFSNLMKTIGMSAQSRARMAEEGFATMQDLLDSYSKTNDLRKLIVNLNKKLWNGIRS